MIFPKEGEPPCCSPPPSLQPLCCDCWLQPLTAFAATHYCIFPTFSFCFALIFVSVHVLSWHAYNHHCPPLHLWALAGCCAAVSTSVAASVFQACTLSSQSAAGLAAATAPHAASDHPNMHAIVASLLPCHSAAPAIHLPLLSPHQLPHSVDCLSLLIGI